MRHPSHRHFVILPLLALSMLGTAVTAMPGAQSGLTAITATANIGEVFTHVSGIRGIQLPGAELDLESSLPELREGSVLVASEVPGTLRTGAFTLTALGGGYYVTKSGDSVTVAALTAPVLISAGTARAVVPAGMQWRVHGDTITAWDAGVQQWMDARKVTPLPERFFAEQRENLRALTGQDLLPESQTNVSAFSEATVPEYPEAYARRREKWAEQVLGVLRTEVETGDAIGVQEMLLRSDLADAFSTSRAQSVISSLLFTTHRSVALQQQFLPFLTKDADLWLLLSLHPTVSTVVWTLPAPPHAGETQSVRLLTFPFADIGGDAGYAGSWKRWEEQMLGAVSASKNSHALTEQLIMRLGTLAIERERSGYPERARFMSKTLQALGDRVKEDLSSEATAMLQTLSQFDRVGIAVREEAVSSVSSQSEAVSSVQAEPFDANRVEAQARQLLQSSGAAFSLETRILPVGASHALIENIVYAGHQRDRTLTFTLDITQGAVSGIHEGGEEYPYALPIGEFVEWLRK